MPRKSDGTKGKLGKGITESRFSVVLNIVLVQMLKHVALHDDITEKDLYYGMMKKFIDDRPEVRYPEYLEKEYKNLKGKG